MALLCLKSLCVSALQKALCLAASVSSRLIQIKNHLTLGTVSSTTYLAFVSRLCLTSLLSNEQGINITEI